MQTATSQQDRGNTVYVDGQFDDAEGYHEPERHPTSHSWVPTTTTPSSNPMVEGMVTKTTAAYPSTHPISSVVTTTLFPPQHSTTWSNSSNMVAASSSSFIHPAVTPYNNQTFLSTAVMTPSISAVANKIQEQQKHRLLQHLYHSVYRNGAWFPMAVPSIPPSLPVPSQQQQQQQQLRIIYPPKKYHIPIAPRPPAVRLDDIPIAPRPDKVSTKTVPDASDSFSAIDLNDSVAIVHHKTSITKKRRSSNKPLPISSKKHRPASHNTGNDNAIVSLAYGTKLVDRMFAEKGDSDDIGNKPFHQLLSHHPNPVLIPQSDQRLYERIPMITLVQRDDQCLHPVVYPTEIRPPDVLLGRGGTSNRNLGNLYFRQLIAYYRDSYNALRKGMKGQLARNICNYVRCSGGRFLEKRNHHHHHHRTNHENCWYECGDERAQAKCAQALRETNLIRCVSSSTDNDTDDDNGDDYNYDSDQNVNDDDDDIGNVVTGSNEGENVIM